jgi:hypothetical protein
MIIGIGIGTAWPQSARIRLPPGQAFMFSRGQATVNFVGLSASTLTSDGTALPPRKADSNS